MEENGISPMRPDFIIMLILAIIFDLIDIILNIVELLTTFSLPLLSGFLDLLASFIVGKWLVSVGQENLIKKQKMLSSGKGGQIPISKDDIVKRTFLKMGGSFIIEVIPLISFLPTWTINVLLALGKDFKRRIFLILAMCIIFSPLLLLVVSELLYVSPASSNVISAGFDESKLDLYENPNNPNNSSEVLSYEYLMSEAAKIQAINVLGIDPSSIRYYQPQETANLIRAEVCKQWSRLSDFQKHGCSQLDAERAILTYAIGEAELLVHFDQTPNGNLFVYCEYNCEQHDAKCESGQYGTLQPLSVTCDKYFNGGTGGKHSRNQQLAAFWDIKYIIYLGVKEIINKFQGARGSSCQERWENNWDKVFGSRWWVKDHPDRLARAKAKAAEYAPSEYNCTSGGSGQIGEFNPPSNIYGYIYPVPPGKGTNGTYCSDSGTDITVERGTPVMAIADGEVVYITISREECKAHMKDQWCYPPNDPGVARIKHPDGRSSYYAHLSEIDTNLRPGSHVRQGQIIGKSGTANYSPHLHISIYEGGECLSPGKTERLWFNPPYHCPPSEHCPH